jgi:hypothetical protein
VKKRKRNKSANNCEISNKILSAKSSKNRSEIDIFCEKSSKNRSEIETFCGKSSKNLVEVICLDQDEKTVKKKNKKNRKLEKTKFSPAEEIPHSVSEV